ncbi:glycoside hydrolase [Mycena rosella]|uniref:endo-polygalacturonase n=1 Tax=Mycena rosella TaxID=1033263 RepID=A0AAD7CPC4_MYCRO|nr:glycoside hydrolase [Mycena rosella]
MLPPAPREEDAQETLEGVRVTLSTLPKAVEGCHQAGILSGYFYFSDNRRQLYQPKIVNSPERAIAIEGSSLTVSGITVDNCVNTDGFDVAANDVTIESSTVANQDDCLAINRGTNIVFSGNTCSGGHGISVGSISGDTTVSNVQITGNAVTSRSSVFRPPPCCGSTVSSVVYNKLSGITEFGVLIDQSYPSTLGTLGTGVVINTVIFFGTNTIAVGSSAKRVEVNCGSTSSCDGTWNWAELTITGVPQGR